MKGYDSLMFCGYRHLNIDHDKKFVNGKIYINGIEGFEFAKKRLIRYHGTNHRKFLYYIKELEWRHNERSNNLFNLIVNYILGQELHNHQI